jgi:hypothetical protein
LQHPGKRPWIALEPQNDNEFVTETAYHPLHIISSNNSCSNIINSDDNEATDEHTATQNEDATSSKQIEHRAYKQSCSFRLSAKKKSATEFVITQVNLNHSTNGSCLVGRTTGSPRGRSWLRVIKEHVVPWMYRTVPSVKAPDIVKLLKTQFSCDVTTRCINKHLHQLKGLSKDQSEIKYGLISPMLKLFERSYPSGSVTTALERCREGRFERMFISQPNIANTVKFCMPVLSCDACHLKSAYNGLIASVSAMDAERHIIPLCFAICLREDHDNWCWVFQQLKTALGEYMTTNMNQMTIISDRDKGLDTALTQVFDSIIVKKCVFHIQQNIKMMFGVNLFPQLDEIFQKMITCNNEDYYEKLLNSLKEIKMDAYTYFKDVLKPEWFCNCFARAPHWGVKTSNMSESLNSKWKSLRNLQFYDAAVEWLKECHADQQKHLSTYLNDRDLGQAVNSRILNK